MTVVTAHYWKYTGLPQIQSYWESFFVLKEINGIEQQQKYKP